MKYILVAIVLVQLCIFSASGFYRTDANRFFYCVAAEKRDLLLIHYLTNALLALGQTVDPDRRVEDPVAYFGCSPPYGFAENLLAWVIDKTSLSLADIAQRVSNGEVCHYMCNDPVYGMRPCDPTDIGCNCCPM